MQAIHVSGRETYCCWQNFYLLTGATAATLTEAAGRQGWATKAAPLWGCGVITAKSFPSRRQTGSGERASRHRAYVLVLWAGIRLPKPSSQALDILAIAVIAFVLLGMRNTGDLVLWIARQQPCKPFE